MVQVSLGWKARPDSAHSSLAGTLASQEEVLE
jgi:hypothetical protein